MPEAAQFRPESKEMSLRTRPPAAAAALLALLALALLSAPACKTVYLPPPPPPSTPSKVISTEGVEYFVWGLRLTGTNQTLLLKEGGGQTRVPLSIVRFLRLSGPEKENYRQGEIIFASGEKLRGEVFVGHLLQGTTDVGYWNLPLAKVQALGMGSEYPAPGPSPR